MGSRIKSPTSKNYDELSYSTTQNVVGIGILNNLICKTIHFRNRYGDAIYCRVQELVGLASSSQQHIGVWLPYPCSRHPGCHSVSVFLWQREHENTSQFSCWGGRQRVSVRSGCMDYRYIGGLLWTYWKCDGKRLVIVIVVDVINHGNDDYGPLHYQQQCNCHHDYYYGEDHDHKDNDKVNNDSDGDDDGGDVNIEMGVTWHFCHHP